MKKLWLFLIIALLVLGGNYIYLYQSNQSQSALAVTYETPNEIVQSSIVAHFSPKGRCTDTIVNEIGNANKEILVQAYSFTSEPIGNALINAHKRGVSIEIVLDKSQKSAKYSQMDEMISAGIPVYIDAKHAIAHNKIIIIDQETLLTGSFNFSKSAEENNAENLLTIKGNPNLIKQYTDNYADHKKHSGKQ